MELKELKLNKPVIAATLGTGLVLGSGVGYYLFGNKNNESSTDNEKGHNNISSFLPNVPSQDFVVLNVGDHDSVGVFRQDKKIRYCNKKDISLGIIVDSDAEREDAIYDDVDYVKGLVRDYNIDFPVYLNINNIITNDSLNNEMKTKIIKDFMEKCSANNIYVGLYGTDTNLCRVKKYCGIVDYDAYLVQDNVDISYDGTYNVVEDLDGNITSRYDLANVIYKKKLNDCKFFSNDVKYTVSKDEDLADIALKYGMSVNEILKFNNIKKSNVKTGTTLRIPCVISTIVDELPSTSNYSFEKLDEPIRGCDISYAQGDSMDWDMLSNNFEFVILKCSQGLDTDSYFEENAKNCNLNNIPMGVYCFNNYWCDNELEIDDFKKNEEAQADLALSLLSNKKVEYPVYLDIENVPDVNDESELSRKNVEVMLNVWLDKVKSAGYIPGIYCNGSTYEFLTKFVDYDISDKFEVWIAGGNQFTGETTDIPFEDVVVSTESFEDYNADIAQTTDSCVGAGAGNHLGHLDVDFSMVDYTNKKQIVDVATDTDSHTNSEIKEFNKIDPRNIALNFIPILGIGAGAGYFVYKKKKNKVKRK